MGFVETIHTIVNDTLNGVAAAQFGQLASSLGTTGQLFASIMVILVLINMSLQVTPASKEASLLFVVKLVLIAFFFQNWAQFNSLATGILGLFDSVSGALIASISARTGEPLSSPLTFAVAFDDLMNQMTNYMNVTAGRLNLLGSVINGFMWLLSGAFSALAALLMMGSRILISLLIGLAPLAILATLSNVTKTYFERWLTLTISMALYPVIIAGVSPTIIGLMNAVIAAVGDVDSVETLGAVTPIIAIMLMSILLAGMVPVIVSAVSGQIALKDAVTTTMARAMSRLGGSAAASGYQHAARSAESVAQDTHSFMRNPIANTNDAINDRAKQMNRMAAMAERYRRK